MKEIQPKKLKHNSKTTRIKCLHCGHNKDVQRNDAKYCSVLCRVQESNFRKEKGLTFLLFEGTENDLKKFYSSPSGFLNINPLQNDFLEIGKYERILDVSQSWKQDFPDFIVYYFINVKSKPYQIFCNETKYTKWKTFDDKNKLLIQKPQKFTWIAKQ